MKKSCISCLLFASKYVRRSLLEKIERRRENPHDVDSVAYVIGG